MSVHFKQSACQNVFLFWKSLSYDLSMCCYPLTAHCSRSSLQVLPNKTDKLVWVLWSTQWLNLGDQTVGRSSQPQHCCTYFFHFLTPKLTQNMQKNEEERNTSYDMDTLEGRDWCDMSPAYSIMVWKCSLIHGGTNHQ